MLRKCLIDISCFFILHIMNVTLVDLIGPLLVAAAFLVFARGMVRRSKGREFKPLPAFLFLLFALSYRFIFGDGSLLDRLAMMLMDVGIGMLVDAAYLAYHKERAKMFSVPGILALGLSGILHVFCFACNTSELVIPTDNAHQILVELGPDDDISEIKKTLKKYHAYHKRAFPEVSLDEDEDLAQFYIVTVDPALKNPLMKELRMDQENVDYVEKNYPLTLIKPIESSSSAEILKKSFLANDPYLHQQWFADKLSYNEVYGILKNTTPVKKAKLAIVDTGVEGVHEDLKGIFTSSPGETDFHGHGTHCAGIAGGETNNGKGIGSLNWEGKFVTITGFHALDRMGRGTDQTVARAIIQAAEDGSDVISMSLGGFHPRPPRVQVKAVEYARSKGAIVIVAAGNSNDDARRYSPANIEGVIVVGAVNEELHKAPFSNRNTKLKMPIAAPGVNIMSSFPGSLYKSFSGTSMATPLVAGLVGIMKSLNPDLTTQDAYRILHETGSSEKNTDAVGKVVMPVPAINAVLQVQ